jgi:hypothetical protein
MNGWFLNTQRKGQQYALNAGAKRCLLPGGMVFEVSPSIENDATRKEGDVGNIRLVRTH